MDKILQAIFMGCGPVAVFIGIVWTFLEPKDRAPGQKPKIDPPNETNTRPRRLY